ncbi:MAG: hypothetical protein Kow0068_14940 [Marinilabiliales bacterium]
MKRGLISFSIILFAFTIAQAQLEWGQFDKTMPWGQLSSYDDYNYGYSLDIDGNYAVVGARGANTSTGFAYVLYYNGTYWETQAKLLTSDGLGSDEFGYYVSIKGDYVAVGAPGDNGIGSVYVYKKPVSGWSGSANYEIAKLTPSNGSSGDLFGRSIAMDDSTIYVSAYGYNSYEGAVYIFNKPSGEWASANEDAIITSSVGQAGDDFGKSIAIYDSILVIGAYQDDYSTFTNCGSVYIYNRPQNGWITTSNYDFKITAFDKQSDDNFGRSVAIFDSTIVVGAYGVSTNTGVVYLYQYNSSQNDWLYQGKLIPSDADQDDYFGISVAIENDIVVVGAYNQQNGSNTGVGSAYIFEKPQTGWQDMNETQKITALDNDAGDNFGISVDISNQIIGVGAYNDDESGSNSGAAYWFAGCTPTSATIVASGCVSYTSPSGNHTWTNSGVYQDTLVNSTGCDSVLTINLTIYQQTTSTINVTSCESYISPSGNYTWISSGNYLDTIPNSNGCDSIITINLTIQPNNINTGVTQNGNVLTSNAISGTYQWYDCNMDTEITGETSQVFTAQTNGSYAVIIQDGACVDTSACYDVTSVNIKELNNSDIISISPNPTSGLLNIKIDNSLLPCTIKITDISGRNVKTIQMNDLNNMDFEIEGNAGIYYINFISNDLKKSFKLIKTK